jgi:hypothetical protein
MAHATLANAVLEPSQEQISLFLSAITSYRPNDSEHIGLLELLNLYSELKILRESTNNSATRNNCNQLANNLTTFALLQRNVDHFEMYFEMKSSKTEHNLELSELMVNSSDEEIRARAISDLEKGELSCFSQSTIAIRFGVNNEHYMCIPLTVLTPSFAKQIVAKAILIAPLYNHTFPDLNSTIRLSPSQTTRLAFISKAINATVVPYTTHVLRVRAKK